MRKLTKLVAVAFSVLIGSVIVTIIALKLISDETYKGWIVRSVQSATDRELSIAGDFKLDIGAKIQISASDIQLANAEWGTHPELFAADHVGAEIDTWSLLSGVVEIVLRADAPKLMLETSESGRGNWKMTATEPKPKSENGRRFNLLPVDIQVENALVLYLDGASRRTDRLELDQFRFGQVDAKLGVVLKGRYNEKPVTLSGDLGNLATIRGGQSTDVRVDAQFGAVGLSIQGSLADVMNATGPTLDVGLAMKAPSTAVFDPFTTQKVPDLGPVELDARISGSAGAYAAHQIHFQLHGNQTNANITGDIDNLLAVTGVELSLNAVVGSLAQFSELAKIQLPDTDTIGIRGRVTAKQGLKGPIQVTAKLGGETLTADIETEVTVLRQAKGVDMALTLQAASLADLGRLGGARLSDTRPLKIDAKLTTSPGQFNAESIEAVLGKSTLKGSLNLLKTREKGRGRVEGRLASQLLDLNEILGSPKVVARKPKTQTKDTGKPAPAESAKKIFSSQTLPFDLLGVYDADIELVAKKIHFRIMEIEDTDAAFVLRNGALALKVNQARVGDRPVRAGLTLNASQQPAVLDLQFDAHGIPLSSVIAADAALQGGHLILDIKGNGAGDSMSEIMGSLNGHFTAAVRGSRMPDSFFNRFGEGLLSRIDPLAAERGYTKLDCGAVHFDVKDGIAKTPRGLALQTSEVTWTGSGKIDLKTEELDVRARSRPRKGLGISVGSLAKIVRLGGTLAEPSLEPDPVGLAKTGTELGFAVSTAGISFLVKGLFDRVRSGEDVCTRILKEIAQKEPVAGAESTEDN